MSLCGFFNFFTLLCTKVTFFKNSVCFVNLSHFKYNIYMVHILGVLYLFDGVCILIFIGFFFDTLIIRFLFVLILRFSYELILLVYSAGRGCHL